MEQNNVLSKFDTLPPEAQRQVVDFIAFLQTRYRPIATGKTKPYLLFSFGQRLGFLSKSGYMKFHQLFLLV